MKSFINRCIGGQCNGLGKPNQLLTVARFLYVFTCSDVIHHLFQVASGLDSMILGETQILGQISHSYRIACQSGTTNTVMNMLFQKAIAVGKRIHTDTAISEKAVSIGSAVVELSAEIQKFLQWLCARTVVPTIVALNNKGHDIKDRELRKVLNKLPDLSIAQKNIVVSLADSVVNKLLHYPIAGLKNVCDTPQSHIYSEVLQELFELETSGRDPDDSRFFRNIM